MPVPYNTPDNTPAEGKFQNRIRPKPEGGLYRLWEHLVEIYICP